MTPPNEGHTHSYGSAIIKDQATAVLGNDYSKCYNYGSHISIQSATFLLQEAPTLASSEPPQPFTIGSSDAHAAWSGRQHSHESDVKYQNVTTHHRLERPSNPSHRANLLVAAAEPTPSVEQARLWQYLAHAIPSSIPIFREIAQRLADHRVHSPNLQRYVVRRHSVQVQLLNDATAVAAPSGMSMIAALLCAVLAVRHTSPSGVLKTLAPIQQDPVFPFLAAMAGYWLSTMLNKPVTPGPTELSGDHIMFEDVFQAQRKLPVSYLASIHILEGFFRTHYRGSPVEYLIESKQYGLRSGRYILGAPLILDRICSDQLVPGGVLVMSITYRAGTSRCLECTNKLAREETGRYRCSHCWRTFGIPSANEELTVRPDTAYFLRASWQVSRLMDWGPMGGLQNVELIIPYREHPDHCSDGGISQRLSVFLTSSVEGKKGKTNKSRNGSKGCVVRQSQRTNPLKIPGNNDRTEEQIPKSQDLSSEHLPAVSEQFCVSQPSTTELSHAFSVQLHTSQHQMVRSVPATVPRTINVDSRTAWSAPRTPHNFTIRHPSKAKQSDSEHMDTWLKQLAMKLSRPSSRDHNMPLLPSAIGQRSFLPRTVPFRQLTNREYKSLDAILCGRASASRILATFRIFLLNNGGPQNLDFMNAAIKYQAKYDMFSKQQWPAELDVSTQEGCELSQEYSGLLDTYIRARRATTIDLSLNQRHHLMSLSHRPTPPESYHLSSAIGQIRTVLAGSVHSFLSENGLSPL